MQSNVKKRIGILRGGAGKHYASSLARGGDIISHIHDNLGDKYKTFDILIDKEGIWYLNGRSIKPSDLIQKVDMVWNEMHPSVSIILNNLAVPNVGNASFSHTLQNSKDLLREHIKSIGVYMPKHIVLPLYQEDFDGPREKYAVKKAKEVFEKFSAPWIVKSFTPDSNMGMHVAKTFPELVNSIEDGVKHEKSILVEEFIAGKIASLHSVSSFRNQDIYIFPLGNTYGNFSSDEKEKLNNIAKSLHQHIGAEHYLKSDFVLSSVGKSGQVYLLGIESTPDLKPDSHFSQVCESVGAKPHNIIEYILERTIN